MLRRGLTLLMMFALPACAPEGNSSGHDSGPIGFFSHDAGHDGGASLDSGSPHDAGEEIDAGVTIDAGSSDAGIDTDAGAPDDGGVTVDAGPSDAGTHDAGVVDAGPRDAGPFDAGETSTLEHEIVSGRLVMDPLDLKWRGLLSTWTPPGGCTSGQAADGTAYDLDGGSYPFVPPCFEGTTVSVIDQIRQTQGHGPLGSGGVAADGTYAAPHINLVNTTLGLIGSVTDPSGLLAPSAGIVALPPFSASGTAGAPIPVVSVAFMQHIASVIHMPYATMMSQGVALIHIVQASDGQTPAAGEELYWWQKMLLGELTGGFFPNTYLTKMPFSDPMNSAPYTYYLSADTNAALPYSNGNIVTSASGLAVIVGPRPLIYTTVDAGPQYEMAYTASTAWGSFITFAPQPGAVVDVYLNNQ
jgi:hypothetical protein